MRRHLTCVAVAAILFGCPKSFSPANPPCDEDTPCTAEVLGSDFEDYSCDLAQGRCVRTANLPTPDSGPPPVDVGLPESGPSDTGPVDTGAVDAGLSEAGPPVDSGPPTPEHMYGVDACRDAQDNDEDGATDCDDSDCADLAYCAEEICDNDFDDNANDLADCDDPACQEHWSCLPRVTICDLHTANLFGGCGSCHTDPNNSVPSGGLTIDNSSPSALYTSLMTSGTLQLPQVVDGAPEVSLLYAKLAGTQAQLEPACADGNAGAECRAERGQRMPRNGNPFSAEHLGMVQRWIAYGDLQRCLPNFPVEDCTDGLDNDGDTRVDCDDRECRSHVLCGDPVTICDLHTAGVFSACRTCHQDDRRGGFSINTASPRELYTSLVGSDPNQPVQGSGGPLVHHGDRLVSYLYLKLTGQQESVQNGTGERMPLSADPLSETQINMVRSWIEQTDALDACLDP